MIKMICLLKRKEGMTPEEFHRYWREQHGPLVMSTKSASWVRRYEQNHRPLSDYRAGDDRRGWDGVTIQWFDSMDDFHASLGEDDYALIDEDTRRFLDVEALQLIFTEEGEEVPR
jgi:uncharacterized protein (TIGR02118 family)